MLSVLAVQLTFTSVELFATAEVITGAVGACTSAAGAETVMVTAVVVLPAPFVAVSLYVVVCAGDTDLEVAPVTLPIPLSMVMAVAPDTLQDKSPDCPAVIVEGVAVNDDITGAGLGVGVGFGVGVGVGVPAWST